MSPWHSVLATLEAAGQRFAEVDLRLALLALLFHVANHALRSVAWRNVLAAAYPQKRVPLLDVGTAYALGVALNAALPGRGGDAAKVAAVRARLPESSVPTIASSMSVIVLFDAVAATLLVLGVGLAGMVPFAPQIPSVTAPFTWISGHVVPALAAALLIGLAVRVVAPRVQLRVRALWLRLRQGGAILRTPGRYARRVALIQAGAWACRISVVFCLLTAFHLPASVPTAALVMVTAGFSTLIPLTPGGAGTQQVLLTYALQQTASAAAAVSFSVGMQVSITIVNVVLGVAAAMVVFGTLRPIAAVRSSLRATAAGG